MFDVRNTITSQGYYYMAHVAMEKGNVMHPVEAFSAPLLFIGTTRNPTLGMN